MTCSEIGRWNTDMRREQKDLGTYGNTNENFHHSHCLEGGLDVQIDR